MLSGLSESARGSRSPRGHRGGWARIRAAVQSAIHGRHHYLSGSSFTASARSFPRNLLSRRRAATNTKASCNFTGPRAAAGSPRRTEHLLLRQPRFAARSRRITGIWPRVAFPPTPAPNPEPPSEFPFQRFDREIPFSSCVSQPELQPEIVATQAYLQVLGSPSSVSGEAAQITYKS